MNAERLKLARQDLQQLVDDTSTIDPDLRKELLYSWERGIVEDKPEGSEWNNKNLLRRDENRKSGVALTNPLEGKVADKTPKTITTAAGTPKEGTSQKEIAKSPLEEPKASIRKKMLSQTKKQSRRRKTETLLTSKPRICSKIATV